MVEVLPQVSDWPAFYQSVGITGVGGAPSTRRVSSTTVSPAQQAVARALETYRYGGPTRTQQPVPERLSAGQGGMPANYGSFTPQQVAQIGRGVGEQPPLRVVVNGANPIMAYANQPAPPAATPATTAIMRATTNPPVQNGGLLGALSNGVAGIGDQIGRMAQGVGPALMRSALGTIPGRTAIIDGAIQRMMNDPSRRNSVTQQSQAWRQMTGQTPWGGSSGTGQTASAGDGDAVILRAKTSAAPTTQRSGL